MRQPRVLVTGAFDVPPELDRRLRQVCVLDHLPSVTEKTLVGALRRAEFYILGGPEYLNSTLLGAALNLRGVVVMGTGTPSFVDVDATTARGIRLQNVPGINADAVSEFAIGMILAVNARVFQAWEGLGSGMRWWQPLRHQLNQCSIGLVGLGRIGRGLAERLRGIAPECDIRYWSRTRKPELERDVGVRWMALRALFETCDLCSIQLAYDASTTHRLINSEILAACRHGIRLVHLSNPRIIDASALRSALQTGRVGFAYFDGYYREGYNNLGVANDPEGLLSLGTEKFVATSHIAALTQEAQREIMAAAIDTTVAWILEERRGGVTRGFEGGE
jgi:glyoxylate reductase